MLGAMRWTLLALAALGAAARSPAAAAAAPAPVTLVAVAPGYPGSTAEAQPSMDAFAAALAQASGLPRGAVRAVYDETEERGLERLAEPGAALALVPLPLLVKHGQALKLTPRLQVEQKAAGLAEVWSLVARKGRVASPAALAGFTVLSVAGYAPGFVRGALAAWGELPAGAKVAQTSQVLSALRRASAGEDVAVLLDGAQTAALASLSFAAELEVVARSAPLPAAFVCTVGKKLPVARWKALERGFAAVGQEPAGAAALEAIRVVRFLPASPEALAVVRRLAAGAGR